MAYVLEKQYDFGANNDDSSASASAQLGGFAVMALLIGMAAYLGYRIVEFARKTES